MKNKKLIEQIKKEFVYLTVIFVTAIIIFKIAFYKENFITIIRAAIGIFWPFVLPGFYLLYYWHDKMDFIERFIIGIVLSIALVGITSYYIGLLGFHVKYHIFILPLFYLIVDFVLLLFRK